MGGCFRYGFAFVVHKTRIGGQLHYYHGEYLQRVHLPEWRRHYGCATAWNILQRTLRWRTGILLQFWGRIILQAQWIGSQRGHVLRIDSLFSSVSFYYASYVKCTKHCFVSQQSLVHFFTDLYCSHVVYIFTIISAPAPVGSRP